MGLWNNSHRKMLAPATRTIGSTDTPKALKKATSSTKTVMQLIPNAEANGFAAFPTDWGAKVIELS